MTTPWVEGMWRALMPFSHLPPGRAMVGPSMHVRCKGSGPGRATAQRSRRDGHEVGGSASGRVVASREGADDEETVIGHRIEFSNDGLSLGVDVDDNGRIAIATIAGGGTSLQARHHVAAPGRKWLEGRHRFRRRGRP